MQQLATHPLRGRTYWYLSPRGFANEYAIGIATNQTDASVYRAEGYQRIDRDRAVRELTNRGDEATEILCHVTLDGEDVRDRFVIARRIAKGVLL